MRCAWSAPANIALVKYWGKTQGQIPMNPSLSLTLNKARTFVQAELLCDQNNVNEPYELHFQGQKAGEKFQQKFQQAWKSWELLWPIKWPGKVILATHNNFPHSAGIASSASSYAAMAAALWDLQRRLRIGNENLSTDWELADYQMASELARLGSGSASRSLQGPLVSWGVVNGRAHSSHRFAHCLEGEVPTENLQWKDAVLIIDAGEKSVSSAKGHDLMNGHIYREARIKQAQNNWFETLSALTQADWEKFSVLVEEEAMSLHSLMMTSRPSFVLAHPKTWVAIEEVKSFRKINRLPITFTLDAGPNLHILYPSNVAIQVERWIHDLTREMRLTTHFDEVGKGIRVEALQ